MFIEGLLTILKTWNTRQDQRSATSTSLGVLNQNIGRYLMTIRLAHPMIGDDLIYLPITNKCTLE
jgi:hypothetical protein